MEVNTLSEPVKTSFGYHLIQKTGHVKEGTKPLEEVEFRIREKLSRERAETESERLAQELYARLIEQETVSDDDLRTIADNDPKVTFNTTDPFSEDDVVPGIGKNEAFLSGIFAKELEVGKMTAPVKIGRGFAIARLTSIIPEGIPPFEDVRAEVETAFKKEKAHDKGQQRLVELLSEGGDLDQIAKGFNLQVKSDQSIRYLSPVPGLGNKKSLHQTLFSVQTDAVTDPVEVDNGWALFVVTDRKGFDQASYETKRPELLDNLKSRQVSLVIRAIVERVKKEIKIHVNQEYISRLS